MKNKNLFIFDTNSIISAFLLPKSKSRDAFNNGLEKGSIIASDKTFEELWTVLRRKKFEKYASIQDREKYIDDLKKVYLFFTPKIVITACRDPKDNKFLELAIAANASCIITGDKDLLILNPFRNIPILNAVDFLNNF